MGAGNEWANDAAPKPKHNPIRHDIAAIAMWAGLAVIEWWDDRSRWERVAGVTRVLIVTAAVAAVVFLSGCRTEPTPTEAPVSGVDQGHVEFSPEQALVGRLNNALETNR